MRVGVWIYGLATIVTGILDIVWGAFESSHQPIQALGEHIPFAHPFAYIAGAWLVAAGVAILWRRTERFGAAGSAIIYLVFALLSVPRFYTATHKLGFHLVILVFILFGIGQQLLLMSPAFIVLADRALSNPVWRERAATAGRWTLGLGPIVFGLGHLISPHGLARFVPHWVAFPVFWAVFAGVAFLLAGLAIVSGIRDVLAARLLGLMLLLFEAIVEIPPVFAQPHSQVAWGGAVYNVTAIGACLIFAQFVIGRRQTHLSTRSCRTDRNPSPRFAHRMGELRGQQSILLPASSSWICRNHCPPGSPSPLPDAQQKSRGRGAGMPRYCLLQTAHFKHADPYGKGLRTTSACDGACSVSV
jgi:uncharacterized membrane protein